MRKLRLALFVAAALVPRTGVACGVCQCGDPTYALIGSQLFVPNAWNLGLDFGRFSREQATEHEPTETESDTEQRVTFSASRTFGDRLTLVGRLPFVDRKVTGGEHFQLSGLSDPEVFGHYRISSSQSGTWIALTLGTRLGLGANDRQLEGERAEEMMQPGAGSSSVEAGFAFSHLIGMDGTLFGSASGRLNGRNDHGYHYGNLVFANAAYEKKLASRVNAVMEVNFRHSTRDEWEPGDINHNTGGTVVYVSPRVLFKVDKGLFFRLGIQLPIVESLNGEQNEKVNLLTGFTARF